TEAGVLLSGADGTRLWTFDARLTDPPSALGSIDGGAGSDVLFWEGWYPTEEEAPGVIFRIRLRRVDGATGQHRFTTQHDLVEQGGDIIHTIYALPIGDVNDDGVPDIGHAVWRYEGYWVPNATAASILRVESGADGSELLRLDRDRKALLYPGGDLVPGGLPELFEASTPPNDLTIRLAVVELPTGRTVWSRTDGAFVRADIGALRGPADDLVAYARTRQIEGPPRLVSRIEVLRGPSGDRIWTLGPEF
ncbi:MAG TPA: hypothetical protein VEA19_07265, partial [Actinomycetota bacterium]|nr:hypothetical protein [Actinomycetota bacterium]